MARPPLLLCALVLVAVVAARRLDRPSVRSRPLLRVIEKYRQFEEVCEDVHVVCNMLVETIGCDDTLKKLCRKSCNLCSNDEPVTSARPSLPSETTSCSAEPKESCGMLPVEGLSKRVVGGNEADPHEWPSICYIERNFGFFGKKGCGGTLVKNEKGDFYIITAAHCTDNPKNKPALPDVFEVKCGIHDLNGDSVSHEQTFRVEKIMRHEEYIQGGSSRLTAHDIAILHLNTKPIENDFVQAACLPKTAPVVNEKVIVVGWGHLWWQNKTSLQRTDRLHYLVKPIVSDGDCERMWNANGDYNLDCEKMGTLCAGYEDPGKGSCKGDSGGPLYAHRDGRWTLIGVVSFGQPCAKADYVDVYADVFSHLDWIKSKINN